MPNVSPPTNWFSPGFDDSTWGFAQTIFHGPTDSNDHIWAENPARSSTENALFREHFNLPAVAILSAVVTIRTNGQLLAAYINGHPLPINGTTGWFVQAITIPVAWLVAPGDNLFAMEATAAGYNGAIEPPLVGYVLDYTS